MGEAPVSSLAKGSGYLMRHKPVRLSVATATESCAHKNHRNRQEVQKGAEA